MTNMLKKCSTCVQLVRVSSFRNDLLQNPYFSELLNCFALRTLWYETKQLRSLIVKLLVVMKYCLKGSGFIITIKISQLLFLMQQNHIGNKLSFMYLSKSFVFENKLKFIQTDFFSKIVLFLQIKGDT